MAPAGAQKVVLDLAVGAKRQGHEVEVFALTMIPSHFMDELNANGIPLSFSKSKQSVYSPLNIFSIGRKMKGFDIVHVHLFPSQYWVAGAKVLFRGLPPIVTTEHNTTNKRRGKWIWKLFDSFAYSKYSCVIPCSKEAGESFSTYLPKVPIKVVQNGLNLDFVRKASKLTKKDLFGLDAATVCIGIVARLQFPKRQDLLIEAIADLPQKYHAIIVGDGERREFLEKLALEKGVASRCHFLGIRSDVPTIIKACDINCLISEHEGLSISSIECMASGKPFIASDVAGLHDIVCGYGLLVHNTVPDLKKAILMLEAKEKYDEIANSCSQRCNTYSIEKVVEEYIGIYTKCRN